MSNFLGFQWSCWNIFKALLTSRLWFAGRCTEALLSMCWRSTCVASEHFLTGGNKKMCLELFRSFLTATLLILIDLLFSRWHKELVSSRTGWWPGRLIHASRLQGQFFKGHLGWVGPAGMFPEIWVLRNPNRRHVENAQEEVALSYCHCHSAISSLLCPLASHNFP